MARQICAGLLAILAAVSFLPLLETDAWWIRIFDFPRIQLAIGIALLAGLLAALAWPRGPGLAPVALAAAALVYHLVQLYPYAPFAEERAAQVATCDEARRLSVLVANVQESNEQGQEFLEMVERHPADLVLVLETDDWWDRHLSALDEAYPRHVGHVAEEDAAFGMHLYSRHPLVEPDFVYLFDAFTPSVSTGVRLPGGDEVRFLGLHPRPPQAWSQPTTSRDAHLLAAALQAEAAESPAILAGDFNAVPWEETNRRAARLGGLLDPRHGRGLFNTFKVGNPLIEWPLDQVLFQEELALVSFEVLPGFGSDHRPVRAELCLHPDAAAMQTPPAPQEDDRAEARATIAAAEQMDMAAPASE
ncbi:endonuclease/exonuclease/phosphatase family protein [Tranquillimonas alkanivorans]|uniref:endonuclease/exonuclease/phosphatase family protein n=1 Tax=Tranquillimonas alkanivorans TaxID=441119 RepID=UPI000B8786DB|nr:endonuclease/exonuclease/phosphatase family protein [Tranquillimonas alkanivorans]